MFAFVGLQLTFVSGALKNDESSKEIIETNYCLCQLNKTSTLVLYLYMLVVTLFTACFVVFIIACIHNLSQRNNVISVNHDQVMLLYNYI